MRCSLCSTTSTTDSCRDERELVRRASDGGHEPVDCGVGQRGHLVVGAILDRVGDAHPRRVETERRSLSGRGIAERVGRDEDPRDVRR